MKHFLFIFCLFIQFSCNEKKYDKTVKTVIVYNEKDYDRYFDKKVKIIIKDTMCSYEEKRAVNDIKKEELKIYFSFLNFKKEFAIDGYKELQKYLSKYNIAVDTIIDEYSSGCCHSSKFERYCYQKKMKEEIEKRHGKNFLDSLCNQVEKDFVEKNPNRIYKFTECDMVSRYPNAKNYSDMFDKSEKDFFRNFIYPKEYIFKNERSYSYTSSTFILSKTGEISNLKTKATFQNPKNEKFRYYFETEMEKFIKKIKFIPAVSCGIPVKSEMELTFTNK